MATLTGNPETDELVHQIAATTGEPAEVALNVALRERLDRVSHRKGRELLDRIRPMLDRVAELPELDLRSTDELIGYSEHGTFD